MKRVLALLLALILVLPCVTAVGASGKESYVSLTYEELMELLDEKEEQTEKPPVKEEALPEQKPSTDKDDAVEGEVVGGKDVFYYDIIDGEVTITGYDYIGEEVFIPNTLEGYPVTAIGESAFDGASVKRIHLPEGLTAIGDGAFYYCRSLEYVSLPETLIAIGANAFYGCGVLTSIELPSSVKEIARAAFYYCYGLQSIVFPEGLERIGNDAFSQCAKLVSVELPSTLVEIEAGAFEGCYCIAEVINHSSLDIKKDWYNGGVGAYAETIHNGPSKLVREDGFVFWRTEDGYKLISYEGNEAEPVIPTLDAPCYVIRNAAFYGNQTLESIVIPEGVTKIMDHVFFSCEALQSIKLPESLTSLGYCAFSYCWELSDVVLPAGLTEMEGRTFDSCQSLTEIVIPDGVTTLNYADFSQCYNLRSITLPASLTEIGDMVFRGCRSLTSIRLPASLERIDSEAFEDCYLLVEVINHSSLELTVGDWSNGCVAYYAFDVHDGQSKLVKENGFVFFPVENGYRLVSYEGNEAEPVIPTLEAPCVQIGTYAFFNCDKLVGVSFPEGIELVEDRAFYNCSLEWVVFSDGLLEMEDCAFESCWLLSEVTLPASLERLGGDVFYGCYQLAKVNYTGLEEQWNQIDIEEDNYYLSEAKKEFHYGCHDYVDACDKDCSECGFVRRAPHDYVDEVCVLCGAPMLPESSHPYANNCNEWYSIHREGAVFMAITFTEDSYTEQGWDALYVYDKGENLINGYSGDLGGKRCVVYGDTIRLNLVSDGTDSYYGFAIDSLEVYYSDCAHESAYLKNAVEPDCDDWGYTGDIYCPTCQVYLEWGEDVSFLGHDFENDVCERCGQALWEYEINDGEVILYKYNGFEEQVTVPSAFEGCPVTAIGNYAFEDCQALSVNLPESVTYIDECAFLNCDSLQSITVPEGVTEIAYGAFYSCESLQSVTLPVSLKQIGGDAFANDYELSKVNYEGTREQWDQIVVGEGNSYLLNAYLEWHYGQHDYVDACDADCSVCGYERRAPHSYVDGVCELCGFEALPESPHPYPNYFEQTYTIYREGAKRLAITLSKESRTELDCDDLIFFNGDGEFIVSWSGAIGEQRLVVEGDTVQICLKTDGSVTYYGFAIEKLEVFYEDCLHQNVEIEGAYEPQCEINGYSGDTYCLDCGLKRGSGEILMPLGHDFSDNVCVRCQTRQFSYEIVDGGAFVFRWNDDAQILTVPSTLGGCPVVGIANYTFSGCGDLREITLPVSLLEIGNGAFSGCSRLKKVNYEGTREQWDQIVVGDDNSYLLDAPLEWHYGQHDYVDACDGDCSVCGYERRAPHSYVDGVCELCGFEALPESPHPYPDNFEQTYTIYREGAKRIAVTFSADSQTESMCDWVTIYDKEQINYHSLSDYFGGQRIVFCGDTVQIHFRTDGSVTYYGFAIEKVEVFYEECYHENTTYRYALEPTCENWGSTGQLFCLDCEMMVAGANQIPPLGHDFADGQTCSRCPASLWGYRVVDGEVYIYGYYGEETHVTVPATLDGYPVVNVERGTFDYTVRCRLASITLPESLQQIEPEVFNGCFHLSKVNYYGTLDQWNRIEICEGNEELLDAKLEWCYGQHSFDSLCDADCDLCGYERLAPHSYADGVCTLCGEGELPQTAHPYGENDFGFYTIHYEGAKRIAITFYGESCISNEGNELYVYNVPSGPDQTPFRIYTGHFGGTRVVVEGDTVQLGLASYNDVGIEQLGYYGFAVEKVEVFYEDCTHENAELLYAEEPDCDEWGYTGDWYCKDCDTIIEYGESLEPVGHDFVDNFCQVCGSPCWYYEIEDGEAILYRYFGDDEVVIVPESFEGCPLTLIADGAFDDCDDIRSVVLPSTLEKVGDSVFYSCSSLYSVTLPASLTWIGYSAFDYCHNLSEVNYCGTMEQWNKITVMDGNDALLNAYLEWHYGQHDYVDACDVDCSVCGYERRAPHSYVDGVCELCGVEALPESPHPYPDDFEQTYTIYREGAKRIAVTFSRNSKTESNYDLIYVGNGTAEAVYCLDGDFGGERVSITGDTVQIRFTSDGSINYYGFAIDKIEVYYEDCTHENLEFRYQRDPGCVSWGYTGDWYCPDCGVCVESGESISPLGHNFVDGYCTRCKAALWEYRIVNGEATITAYNGNDRVLIVPEVIDGCPVTVIGEYVFSVLPPSAAQTGGGRLPSQITEVILPDTLKYIEESAFYGCYGLTSITLPEGLEDIGYGAFIGCDGLVEVINLSSLVLEKGSDAYGSVAYYAEVIHSGESELVKIDGFVFLPVEGGYHLVSYTGEEEYPEFPVLDAPCLEVRSTAFCNNKTLRGIELPDGITSIGEYAFSSCYKLSDIRLPESLQSIGEEAFVYCSELEYIELPKSLQSIGRAAFDSCYQMSEVVYAGTEEEWEQVWVDNFNDCLLDANLTFAQVEVSYLLGDANGDGLVNFSDIQRIYQHLSTNNKLDATALIAADANKDGLVNFSDIQRIYQHLSTPNKLF